MRARSCVADAAGADLVITTKGSVDLYNPKTVRSTAGSLFHVPIIQGVQLEGLRGGCEVSGYCCVGC